MSAYDRIPFVLKIEADCDRYDSPEYKRYVTRARIPYPSPGARDWFHGISARDWCPEWASRPTERVGDFGPVRRLPLRIACFGYLYREPGQTLAIGHGHGGPDLYIPADSAAVVREAARRMAGVFDVTASRAEEELFGSATQASGQREDLR